MHLLALSFVIALIIMLLCGTHFIRLLQKWQIGQVIRTLGPETHYSKKGTPTMGGLLILLAITLAALCLGAWHTSLALAALLILWSFGAIGFLDDYRKLILKDPKGLASRWKYCFQSIFGVIAALWLHQYFEASGIPVVLAVPFSHGSILLGPVAFVALAYFVIVGASNAVNLTDGLDGLSVLSIVLVSAGLACIAWHQGTADSHALALICLAIMGAGLGFWWFNCFPALLFMGDVGALALGAMLGFIALCLHAELAFALMGGIFVLETVSVILQVASFKLRKKRIFKMAPIHHHFELSGWPEPRIVVRFSLVTLILVMIALTGIL